MLFKSVISSTEIISKLTDSEKKKWQDIVTITKYESGQVIFYEGSAPFGVYALQSGMVKLYKTGDKGKGQIFQLCTTGDLFGFHPVLQDSTYPDSACTLEKSEVIFIPKHYFIELVKQSETVSFYLLQKLSEEFSDFVNQETMLSQKPVRQRVATVLLSLENIFSSVIGDDVIPLNRSDLADLCGTVKETLVRILKDFKDEKLIVSDNGRDIRIINAEVLQKVGSD